MSTDEQAMKFLKIAADLNEALAYKDIFQDTFGVNNNLSFHLDGKPFAALARLSKAPVEAQYQSAALHGKITIGIVEFHVCYNLL